MSETWTELPVLERMRRKFLMDADEEKHMEAAPPIVTEPGHEIPIEELCKQGREIAALLQSQGREVAARQSRATLEGAVFKSGKRAGEMRPDKNLLCHAIATVDRKDPVVTANWIDNKLDMAWVGWHDGRRTWVTLVTTLKNLLKEVPNADD